MFSQKGQVSIIMIVMLVATLFFYGISFGWRNAAKVKVGTTNAAIMGAGQVVSLYASYAWMLSNVYLNGKTYKKKCQTNWMMILLPILIIIAIVLTIISWWCGGCFGWWIWGLVVGLFTVTAAVQAYSYSKSASMMVKSWNSQMRETGVPIIDWLEAGLVTAMQYVADDTAMIYDVSDDNEDGEVCDGYTMNTDKKNCPKVMRPTHYMNRRVSSFSRPKEENEDKIEELKEAVRQIGEELGVLSFGDFSDAITTTVCQKVPEKCNSCCMSLEDRPGSCTENRIAQCLSEDVATYEPMLSTKWDLNKPAGVFGMGDFSSRIKKKTPNDPASSLILDEENVFRPQDFEGVVYPLLSLLKDVNVQVDNLTLAKGQNQDENFVWCSGATSGKIYTDADCSYTEIDSDCSMAEEKARVCVKKEVFTKDCFWGPVKQLEQENCNQNTCCVNKFQQWDGIQYIEAPDFVIDKVTNALTTRLENIKAIQVDVTVRKDSDEFTEKEQEAFDEGGSWPVKIEKYPFLSWINTTLVTNAEVVHLIYGLQTSSVSTLQNQGDMVEEFMYSIEGIIDGLKQIQTITKNILNATTYDQDGAWCLPSASTGLSAMEQNAILSEGTNWGSLESVVKCLNYNMNNQQLFDRCLDNCSESCQDLPRSLVLGFDPNVGQDCSEGSEYLKNIERSSLLAKDQGKKFQQRWLFLKYILDAVKRIHTASASYVRLQQKLNVLKKAWKAIQAAKSPVHDWLEKDIVYGWMGPALKGKSRGNWHVVGVSGTGRCLGSHCAGREPWIRIKKSGTFKVCIQYFLEGTASTSTVTIWKWDEDLDVMDKLFKGWFNVEEGNELLKQCVDTKDFQIWCPAGIDADGECLGQEEPYWRPAFVGTLSMKENKELPLAKQQACSALLKKLKRKAISSTKTVSSWGSTRAKGAPWPPRFTIK